VLLFGCAPSTCRAVQPVSTVECRITAVTNSVDAQKRHLDAFMRFCPEAHKLRRFVLEREPWRTLGEVE
jgi:hypothetical protein